MTTRDAFIAVNRFGLGARPGELAEASHDPRGWIERQLAAPPGTRPIEATGSQRMALFQESRRRGGDQAVETLFRQNFRDMYLDDMGRRARTQIESGTPVIERLVAFWSNHFTVSVQRPICLGLAGPFEQEAIRPHVTGRFRDMLLAVARHPAMLTYLDNAQSVGPGSRAGTRMGRGLNENLAREIMELHTLGVNGGYTQTDVRELAKILTGWSLGRPGENGAGGFLFRPVIHEPGEKTLLGVRYAEAGEREGIAALTALARHQATAMHVATKFARHLVADRPPAAAVDRLARVFRDSDGDLGALARAVAALPETWAQPAPKVKTPAEFVVAALRATGFAGESRTLVAAQALLGQPPLAAPSPAGWPDVAGQWIGPESVMRRAEWAMALAQRLGQRAQPMALYDATIGPLAGDATRAAIERAGSLAESLALLFASPEFQRR
ncbi:MAG: DUF1800 domain-containing protein [Alphaproteobacteria bacterium]|nr:DUF1800 domain-containing protein [Alphaproteobacteria bacterium]